MGNCGMDRRSYQMNIDIQCDDIKSLYQEAKQLFQQEERIILTPIMKISANMYVKLENMQISGSFKYRGAYLYFHQIYNDKVIIASSGNFAKACDLAHQKITKERQFMQSRHSKIKNLMSSGLYKDQEKEDYLQIQRLGRQQTQSIPENGQQQIQGLEQNKTPTQIVQEPEENQQFAFRKSVGLSEDNQKAGQLSGDEQDDYSGYDKYNKFSSPNQSFEFKHERNLSRTSILSILPGSQLFYYYTPTDNPDQEGLQIQQQQVQKFSNGNAMQFQSISNDLKNENNKQSNNPFQMDNRVQDNQEYETPTPLPDDQQQQQDHGNKKNNSNKNDQQIKDENASNNNINGQNKSNNVQKGNSGNGQANGNKNGNGNGNGNGNRYGIDNNRGNGNENSYHIQSDAVQRLNNQQKGEQVKESAKESAQQNRLKDQKQLGLQIEKTQSQLIIVVPETVKQEKIKDIKSQVVKFSQDCVECEIHARQYANQNPGYRYFSPYNDIFMVAGNATIGYEIAEQLAEAGKQADFLFVAVGGGGLIAGIAFYFKVIREQRIKIIGVQPEKNCAMYNIIYGKNNILEDTVCDATAGGVENDAVTIQICKLMVDNWVLVKEQDILKGQKQLWNDHKIIVETSAAMAFVACENYQKISSKTYVALLCGGNVDIQF